MSYQPILVSFLLGLSINLATPVLSATTTPNLPHNNSIEWAPCGNNTIPRECGRFEVPLDYKNPKAGTASLAVARLNANVTPRLGTLFVNPGGPGGSGVSLILNEGLSRLVEASGGQYDIVSWDPRGVGDTVPKVECFQSGTEEKIFWNGSIRGGLLELRGNFSDADKREWFYSHVNETDAALVRLGPQCTKESKSMLEYVGTASTVRDMVALHDYLEGTQHINYWGLSYGSLLGNYFVNMFPNRVGRVILDGVVDPWAWATQSFLEINYISLNSSDATFDAFAQTCINAGPSKCPIARNGSTVDSIRAWTFDLIAAVYDNSTATSDPSMTSGELRAAIGEAMYTPTEWASLSQQLAQLASSLGNSTASSAANNIRSLIRRRLPYAPLLDRRDASVNTSDPATDYAYQAITCADAVDTGNITTRDGFESVVDITQHISSMFGPYASWTSPGMYCQRWPTRAVERFTGPFNSKLSNKILVIGNLDDPITPFISAKRVADALGDSAVLIKQNGYGHTSVAMHSNCTGTATAKYFTTGETPSSSLVCETDTQIF